MASRLRENSSQLHLFEELSAQLVLAIDLARLLIAAFVASPHLVHHCLVNLCQMFVSIRSCFGRSTRRREPVRAKTRADYTGGEALRALFSESLFKLGSTLILYLIFVKLKTVSD
jgi:uncharacterized membrane protein YbhN (UPF0104 family)